MKKPKAQVTFIRHYKLAPPYDNRETITDEMYNKLSMGITDPNIHPDIDEYLTTNFSSGDFEKYNLILTSTAKRTQQTARAIIKKFNLEIPIIETKLLENAVWDPSKGPGRAKRFINGTGMSNIADTWKRIEKLKQFMLEQRKEHVLCVTHSFLLKNLYLYFKLGRKNYQGISADELHTSPDYRYLKGFCIEISLSQPATSHQQK